MKKNLQERDRNQNCHISNTFVKHLNRKGKTYNRYKAPITDQVGSSTIIHAPKSISIYSFNKHENNVFNDTIGFKAQLEKSIGKKNCIIDFSRTESFTVAAMLVIFSQIEQKIDPTKFKTSIGWSRKSNSVNKMLRRSGLTQLVKSSRKNVVDVNFTNITALPVITGVGNNYLEDIIDFIQRRIYCNQMDPNTEHKIGDAVAETINNVGRHAYPQLSSHDKQWWLMCEVIGDQLYLAIYDTGVGIPKTVVEKKWFLSSLKSTFPDDYNELQLALGDVAKDLAFYEFKRLRDAELIYMSMQGDVTGTKKSKHGQGSKSLKALVNDTAGGKLWVYSNKGLYKFEPGDTTPQVYKLPLKLSGTLIQWNIKIQ